MFKHIVKATILINFISYVSAYSVRPNIDFYGGDMYPIYGVNESLTCLEYCESIRNCRLLTWCDNTCYIKNKKVSEVEKLDCISIDMYPDDEIMGSNSWSGSWGGSSSESESGSGSNTISVEDINMTATPIPSPTETLPTLTPSPLETKEIKGNEGDAKTANNNSSASRKLVVYSTSMLMTMIVVLF